MNLQEIKQREAKATKGRWASIDSQFVIEPNGDGICQTFDCDGEDYPNCENNLAFIAASREDVPLLVAEVERLRKEVNALENKPLNLYLDRELENERLQAEVERLKSELARLRPSPDSRS